MATAVSPLSDSPTSTRMASTISQLCMAALARVKSPAQSSETTITRLRPSASESEPVSSRPQARARVETDRTMLLCVALMAKARASTGIIGCTQ